MDPSTSLVPFHTNESGELYDSNKQREWFPMNYTYPELQRWKYMKNGEINWDAYNVDLKLTVERLYGKQEKHAFDVPKDVVVSPLHRRLIDEGKDLTLDDYVVNMRYKRFALDGVPYTIHVKLAGTEVGKVYTFTTRLPDEGEAGAEGTSSCVNCRAQKASGALSTGQELISSPLTRLVAKPGGPPRGQRADVIAWLEQPGNVEWNVTVSVRLEGGLRRITGQLLMHHSFVDVRAGGPAYGPIHGRPTRLGSPRHGHLLPEGREAAGLRGLRDAEADHERPSRRAWQRRGLVSHVAWSRDGFARRRRCRTMTTGLMIFITLI